MTSSSLDVQQCLDYLVVAFLPSLLGLEGLPFVQSPVLDLEGLAVLLLLLPLLRQDFGELGLQWVLLLLWDPAALGELEYPPTVHRVELLWLDLVVHL